MDICIALQHFSFDHPPNKRQFFFHDGIPVVVEAMKVQAQRHQDHLECASSSPPQARPSSSTRTTSSSSSSAAEVQHQGMALLYNIVTPDPHATMSLATTRSAALNLGVVDVVTAAQRAHRDHSGIADVSAALLRTLMTDWS